MMLRKIIFLGIFITLLGCGSGDLNISTIVELKNGSIKGVQEGDLKKYLGIPYAEPPVGDLRWALAKPAKNWKGMRSADNNSKICFQPKQIADFYDRVPDLDNMSEDCLTLNVWTRAKVTHEKLPVMVWFHGGALVWGSGSEYPGNELTEHGVILVTVNYRLGPFGFFSHPELSMKNGSSGNQGFSDQIQSLKWVKENIKYFGGDPNNVTIFGESAGSWSVNVLQASPLAKGLFHKAIAQSGTGLPNVLTDIREDKGIIVSAESKGIKLAEYFLGANANIEDLRELPALDIVSIDDFQLDQDLIMMTNQIVDGYVFPESIKDAFINKNVHDLPFMVGFNGDEGTSLFPLIIDQKTFNLFGEFWPESLWAFVNPDPSSFQGPKGMKDFALSLDDNFYDAATDFWGFLFFGAPSYFIAKQHSLSGNPTYLYQFDKKPNIPNDYLGATHALELGYLFNKGGLFGIDGSYDDSDIELACLLYTSDAADE